jgi:hypothetical protein
MNYPKISLLRKNPTNSQEFVFFDIDEEDYAKISDGYERLRKICWWNSRHHINGVMASFKVKYKTDHNQVYYDEINLCVDIRDVSKIENNLLTGMWLRRINNYKEVIFSFGNIFHRHGRKFTYENIPK